MSASVLGLNPSRTLEKSRARLKAKRTAKKEAEEAAGKGGKNHRDASSSSGKENSKAKNNNNASSSSSSAVNASVPPKKGSRAALQKASKALTPQEELFDLDKCMSAMNMYVEKFITRDAATVAADDLREQEAEDRAVKDAAALAERSRSRHGRKSSVSRRKLPTLARLPKRTLAMRTRKTRVLGLRWARTPLLRVLLLPRPPTQPLTPWRWTMRKSRSAMPHTTTA